jgi:hypothetical protein
MAALFGSALLTAADVVSRRDAARLQAKLDRIAKLGLGQRRTPLRTTVSEVELNSYLQYELDDRLPAGVSEPWVSILGDGRLSGRATVDLGVVGEQRKSSGVLDPFSYLSGRLPLLATGVLQTKAGAGSFVLESVSISGVPVPKWMLQEVVSHYSRSSTRPEGVTIERPFALPAGIREIEVGRGQAVVVQ